MATEDQGIMSLPQAGAEPPAPQMSMDEAYDAVQGGLQDVSPEVAGDVQGAISQITPMLDQLSDEEIDNLLELFQYLIEHPEEYSKLVSELVADGELEAGMLPEEYDPELLSALAMVFFTARRQRQAGNEREMAAQMPQPPIGMARGGIAEAARMVAAKGRGGDTMLAHINPEEARILKSLGGSGTINPATGLPEFKWYKKINPVNVIKSVVKTVTKTVKNVVNAVKKVVQSPIGKILATVALATFLGPGAFGVTGLGLSAGASAAIASGAVTAIGGGNVKDILRSAATAYLGAPGGPVSNYFGNAGAALGVTNAAGQAAINAGLTGTAVGVLTGQKLGDAVKSGLIAGAVQGGMTGLKEGFGAQVKPAADLSTPATSNDPALRMPGQPGAATPPPSQAALDQMYEGAGAAARAPSNQVAFDQIYEGAGSPQAAAPPGKNLRYMPPTPGTVGAPGGAPTPPAPVTGSLAKIGGGITDMLKGDFAQGFEGLKSGAGDLFSPKTYTAAELRNTPEYQSAIEAKGATDASALAQASKAYNPSLLRQYGPMAAAGLGIAGLTGGFSPKQVAPSEFSQELRNRDANRPTIEQEPSKYYIQGLPGVEYDDRGRIIGSKPWSPSVTMNDVRVPSTPRTTPTYSLPTIGEAPPMRILQPYNTADMYTNLMSPVSRAHGGVASLAQGGYPRRTGQISGPGTETSDSIPAMLSDGEFVMTAKAVRAAGKGDRRAGAKKMYALMHQLERNASRG